MRGYLAAACAMALLAAGCGGTSSSSGTSGAAPAGTASLAPQDAALWISADTSGDSAQWQALDGVLAKIPGAEGLVDEALSDFGNGNEKLDLRKDIQPALGPEVVVVLPAGASDPVVLAKPTDETKLDKLLKESGDPYVKGKHDDWTVVAQTQKALDAYTAALANGSLSDSDAFQQAMDGLPAEALARAYVDGKGLAGVAGGSAARQALKNVTAASPINGVSSVDPKALAKVGTIGLTVSSGDNVLRVDGNWHSGVTAHPLSYEPTLLRRVPSDALAALSFSGSEQTVKDTRATLAETGAGQLKQIEDTLGVSLDDLVGLASGQGVLYVRPALIIPEVTAVLEPSDPAAALRTLDAAVTKLAAKGNAKVTQSTQGGIDWKQISVSILTVAWGRAGDRIVVTTAPHAYSAFTGDDAKLVDTAGFKAVAADVGLGDKTSGFSYVDVNGLTPLLTTVAGVAGAGSDPTLDKVTKALSAIDALAVNSTADGDVFRFQGVVRVI